MSHMKTLREYIQIAKEEGKAIGHFNISNLEAFHAIVNAGRKLNVPVIIGVSEGEREFTGVSEVVALVKAVKEKYNQPVFLNADHTYELEKIKEAIDAGFDMVITDNAKLDMAANIEATRKAVEYAKEVNARDGRDVLIEGELGYIGQSSKILDKVPDGVQMTSPEDAAKYVRESGIDLLAPAVGNVHGMVKGGNPKLNIDRIKDIDGSAGVPLVLHGASGIGNDELKEAVKAGVVIVHYNTELRVAYRDALKKSLIETNPDEVAPYKFLKTSVEAIEAVVVEKLKVMNNIA